jgi:phi13 family phage major tail protein
MPNNKVTFGLTNVHYSKATQGTDGTWTFATPVRLYGAQEITSDIVGGSTSVYADDVVIATLVQNAGRTISLKITEISDDFKVDILGYKKLTNGNLVEITNADVVTFALGCEFQGDAKARRVWFYLCSVTPINEASKSKADSVEANAITLSITARPIEINSKYSTTHVSSCYGDSNYATFLTSIPELPVIEVE